MENGDYGSADYIFDDKVIMDYCTEFYNCAESKSGETDVNLITSDTPKDPKTNCKEFFQNNYKE
jgi:hypothetical protein